jgi:cytoskeletal protein CcmA (bactofilin family)/Zn finger protein HypA/HybF involved in hydrogenase expression
MSDEPQRHRIEVACPECGHLQAEPALVVSTQCRSCRANFQVRDGKGVVRIQPITRLAIPRKDSDPEPEPPPAAPKLSPIRRGPVVQPPQSFLMRIFKRTRPPRHVTCFNCGHSYTAIAEAQSSQCPKCSGYVSLLSYEINEHWNRRIQTCGDVVIQKNGVVSGVTLQCHTLTVLGELAGSVECSGDLIIRSHGKIIGKVRCQNLRVEKGARVEFLSPVTAVTAFIDGQVRGQISCTGSVTLAKRARLQGLVRTSSLVVKPGAKHTGTIEMISATPSTPA